MSTVVLGPFSSSSPARRVRVGGTRGVGVIHQVRVEPYGRAAAEHAYFDDDEDEAHVQALSSRAVDALARGPVSPAFVLPNAQIHVSVASELTAPSVEAPLPSADLLGVPSGRGPPHS